MSWRSASAKVPIDSFFFRRGLFRLGEVLPDRIPPMGPLHPANATNCGARRNPRPACPALSKNSQRLIRGKVHLTATQS
jgi:hypothetical protein